MGSALFDTVPKHEYLGLIGQNPKKVVDFLELDTNDVSMATKIPKVSIRYDDKIPKELEKKLNEIAIICEMVAAFFDGNVKKAALWFTVPNPVLGNVSPRDMIRFGQFKKLHTFILSACDDTP